ncbi:MAG: glycosyltransferase [Clostridiales bacterium]|nr:glycosyltransferase [Clostridiales bacterium]
MKIIQVISDTNIGGAGVYLLTVLKLYNRSKFDMEVFLPHGSKLEGEIAKLGVKYTCVNHLAEKSFDLRAVRELGKLFAEKKPDIVSSHASLSARVAARLAPGKINIIFTKHCVFNSSGLLSYFPFKQVNGALNNWLSDKIIAVSPAAKSIMTAVGIKEAKIAVVDNGVLAPPVLTGDEKLKIRERYGIGRDKFVVALIGRLAEVKGHKYAVECAKICEKADGGIVFIFAGTGELEAEIKKQIKELNLNNILMPGFVKDVWEIENIMDLQINSSLSEAASLSLLEGMSLGKPAVVSDCGGNPSVIKNGVNGIVFPAADAAQALADSVLAVKRDKNLYEKLAQGALSVFPEKFTAEKMVKRICEVYENAVM